MHLGHVSRVKGLWKYNPRMSFDLVISSPIGFCYHLNSKQYTKIWAARNFSSKTRSIFSNPKTESGSLSRLTDEYNFLKWSCRDGAEVRHLLYKHWYLSSGCQVLTKKTAIWAQRSTCNSSLGYGDRGSPCQQAQNLIERLCINE